MVSLPFPINKKVVRMLFSHGGNFCDQCTMTIVKSTKISPLTIFSMLKIFDTYY